MDERQQSVTLDDLRTTGDEGVVKPEDDSIAKNITESAGGVTELNIADVRAYSPPQHEETYADIAFGKLDAALEKEKVRIDAVKAEAADKLAEQAQLEEEAADGLDDTSLAGTTSHVNMTKKINIPSSTQSFEHDDINVEDTLGKVSSTGDFLSDLGLDDEDEEEDTDESELEEANKRQIAQVKNAVKEKIVPFGKKVDLGAFTMSKKPVSMNKLLTKDNSTIPTADWVLWQAQRSISMSGLKGPEIDKLNPGNSNKNRLNTFKDMYQIIYNHILDANKPDFEAWLKTVKFFDIEHLYFAMYMATFAGSNTVPYTCTNDKCNEVFMVDLSFEQMVKYATPEVKKNFMEYLHKDTTSETDEYNVELYQVSDEYAIALKDPTVYGVIFETAALPEAVTEKYQDLIGIMTYIDEVYYINNETKELELIDTKPDPLNAVKTTARRFKVFYQILNQLNSDQYYTLSGYIKNITEKSNDVKYVLPEVTCPKCGTVIHEEERKPESMLFTRHQLAAIVSI